VGPARRPLHFRRPNPHIRFCQRAAPRGDPMAEKSRKDQAQAQLAKLQRADGARRAMSDYEAEGAGMRAETGRVGALRLARDAAVAQRQATAARPSKPGTKKAASAPSATFSEWRERRAGRRAGA